MATKADLAALINRIRAGDMEAIEQLLGPYKDEAKAAIRRRLNVGNKLRRFVNSSEILQSILIRLFPRAGAPLPPVDNGNAYFAELVRNRVIDHHRTMTTDKRKMDRVSYGDEALAVPAAAPALSEVLLQKERLEQVLNALTPAERVVAIRRMAGDSWKEIAGASGAKAESIRRGFGRTLEMVDAALHEG